MRKLPRIAIPFLLVALLALWIWSANRGVRSATFAGPEFHSRDAGTLTTVHSDLSEHLGLLGFEVVQAPSTMDAWAGVSSKESVRVWFLRRDSRTRRTWVCIDHSESGLRIRVKWEVAGHRKDAELAERDACRVGLILDDWLNARQEANGLPPEFRETKRKWFTDKIAANAKN